MRIARLAILRYGALTDRELAFRGGAAIHVVFGENEAGKSTALAALSDLLFGFGHAKSHAFLHDAASLRLGATLLGRDGSTLSFRRRRGNKNTLLSDDEAEEPLRDDALAPYLGGVTRPIFERAFGLDSRRLREGSKEMLASGGEMGATLFAASSGILGLAETRRSLEAEAERIFTPRRSAQRLFYQILDRHEAARRDEKQSELREGDWKRLNEDIARLGEDHERNQKDRADIRRRREELARLKQIAPIIREIDHEAAQLAAYGDIADLAAGTGARLNEAIEAERQAQSGLRQAQAAVERARREIEGIRLQPELSERRAAIEALFEQRGAYRKAQLDLPRVTSERGQFDADLAAIAARLGLDAARFSQAQPSDPDIARVEGVVEELREADRALSGADARIAEDEKTLRELSARGARATLIDPAPFRDRLAALEPDVARLEALDAQRGELATRRRRLAERAARLDPPIQDLDALARAPLPMRAEIASLRDAIGAARAEVKSAREKAETLAEELATLDREIAAEQGGDLPTRQSIEAARAARDQAIAALGEQDARSLETRLRGDLEQIGALVRAADGLADAAMRDAERIARLEAKLERREEVALHAQNADEASEEAQAMLDARHAAYQIAFAKAGFAAREPEAMMDWLSDAAALLEAREEIAVQAEGLDAVGDLAGRIAAPLREIAVALSVGGHSALPVPALFRALQERMREVARVWQESREDALRRKSCEENLTRFARERTEALERREAIAARLAQEATRLGLRPQAGAREIAAAIAAWREAPGIRAQREDRERRVRGMEREIAAFEETVRSLVAELAPDLARFSPAEAIGLLAERAQEAKAAADHARRADKDLAQARDELHDASRLFEAAREELLRLLAGRAQPEEAGALAARLCARDDLRKSLDDCRGRFRAVAPDLNEGAARARLTEFDPAEATAAIAGFEAEERRLDEEGREIYARLDALRKERAALERSHGAEAATFARRAAEAELGDAARQWAVTKLAAALIGAAIERRRRQNADPTLARASASFMTLTSGAFARLAHRFGADDAPEIVGVRSTGEEVKLDGMSDGTIDQLHLALRIAYLEEYAALNEPMPFIADDLFQTFDDARTAAAIRALGEASAVFQPIVFTHHRSVVEAAREAWGGRADVIDIGLSRRSP